MSRNIALAGMMGVGKTTVGERLAERIGRGFVDTDAEIVRRTGQSIPTIFAEVGEPGFRALERAVVLDLTRVDDLVVGLGGGVVIDDDNVANLLLTGVIVLLEADVDTLVSRLDGAAAGRPLLADGDLRARVTATLERRETAYRDAADTTVDATRDVDAVVEDLLAWARDAGDVLTPSELEQLL